MSNTDRHSAKANYLKTKILTRLTNLLQKNYNNLLSPNQHFILSCLIAEMDYQQIATVHGRLKVNQVETIANQLMQQLSDCLSEELSRHNFISIVEKHYQASEQVKQLRRRRA